MQDFVTSSEKHQLRQSCLKLLGKDLRKASGNIANDFSPSSSPFSLSLNSPLLLSFTRTVALGTLELLVGFHSICGLGLLSSGLFEFGLGMAL